MNKKFVLIATGAAVVVALAGAGIALAVTNMADDNDALTGETLERASNAALAEVGPGTVTSAERADDGGPEYDLEVRLENGDEVDVELNDSFEVVYVGDLDRDDSAASSAPVASATAAPTQSTADQDAANRASAEAAALTAVGSGTVTEFDRSDDADHVYEVEVTLPDGRDVDVELDATFRVTKLDDAVQ